MYEVKRFSHLNSKEFSEKIDKLISLINKGDKTVTEFVKCMEMYNVSSGNDVKHWITGLLSGMKDLDNKYFTYSTVLSRVALNPSQITNSEISKHISDLYGVKFIHSIKQSIINDGKYPSLKSMQAFQYDDEYYVRVLSILILILNKELDVNSIDLNSIWNYEFNEPKLNVTSDKVKSRLTNNELRKLVSTLILNLNGGTGVLKNSDFVK